MDEHVLKAQLEVLRTELEIKYTSPSFHLCGEVPPLLFPIPFHSANTVMSFHSAISLQHGYGGNFPQSRLFSFFFPTSGSARQSWPVCTPNGAAQNPAGPGLSAHLLPARPPTALLPAITTPSHPRLNALEWNNPGRRTLTRLKRPNAHLRWRRCCYSTNCLLSLTGREECLLGGEV